MAVRINKVTITPNELTVGQAFFISISAEEPTWNTLKNELQNWEGVKNNFNSWETVKNFSKKGEN